MEIYLFIYNTLDPLFCYLTVFSLTAYIHVHRQRALLRPSHRQ